jgi:hypothetical protein
MMALHGGVFENYYSAQRVTHIICSNLTNTKVKQFERERCGKIRLSLEGHTQSIKEHH